MSHAEKKKIIKLTFVTKNTQKLSTETQTQNLISELLINAIIEWLFPGYQ